MKILIVSNGFTGATLPLAQHLNKSGNEVKCFYISRLGTKSIESLDFDGALPFAYSKSSAIAKNNTLYNYLSKDIDVNIRVMFKRKRRLEKLLVGGIFPVLNKFLVRKFVAEIISERPDFVYLVVHTELEVQIAKALTEKNIPFSIAYHEVLLMDKSARLKDEVIETLSLGQFIVVHSDKTKADLVNCARRPELTDRINIIHFGPFESYKAYGSGKNPLSSNSNYLLYLGYIHPHKGLKYLYEAVLNLKDALNEKIVVAGFGYDPVLQDMEKIDKFIVINRFIDNDELVGLITGASAVVCPYTAASQSGLVQTAMVFNKPVIATRVGAFTELINDGENGLLCEPSSSKSLAEAIMRFYDKKKELHPNKVDSDYDWSVIASSYINLIKKYI